MRGRASRLVVLVAVGALFLGACSDDAADKAEEDPKGALVDSVNSLGEMDSLSVTLSLQSDPESLSALAAEDGGELSSEDAQKILDSSLTISARKGEEPDQGQAQVIVNVAGNDAVEMRVVDQTLYLQADAPALVETFGQDPAVLDAVGQQAAASGLDFVEPALNGEWLAIQGLDQLAEQFGGVAPSPNAEQQEQFIKDLSEAFESTAEVTSEGEDDVGSHLVATLPVRDLYEKLLENAESLTGAVPGTSLPPASEVPDEDVTVDAWVTDGRLSQVEIDFLQFAEISGEEVPEGVERFAFRVALDEFEGEVAVPEGAVDVDLQEVMQLLGAGAGLDTSTGGGQTTGGGGDTIPGLGVTCAELATQNPDDLQAFLSSDPSLLDQVAQACPELGLQP